MTNRPWTGWATWRPHSMQNRCGGVVAVLACAGGGAGLRGVHAGYRRGTSHVGRGPDVVADIEGRRLLIRDDNVVVFACQDAADRERLGCQPLPAAWSLLTATGSAGSALARRPVRQWGT
jgi:hypothetical protein